MAVVVLPTRRWTPACEELAGQVGADDTLLVVADSEGDEAARRAAEIDAAELLLAGEPEGCSGKANAVAAALEATTDDVIVCTDDDFVHGDGWLEAVRRGVEAHGAVTTMPVFRGEGGWTGRVLEAPVLLFGFQTFVARNGAWGGTLAFRRERLDVAAAVRDLRRTVSDDVLLCEHLGPVAVDLSLVREVPVPGSVGGMTDRFVRFTRTLRYFDPLTLATSVLVWLFVVAGYLLAPVVTAVSLTALAAGLYAGFRVRRPTFLLAPLGFLVAIVPVAYGLASPEFEWGGRRYRWTDKFAVEVLDRGRQEP